MRNLERVFDEFRTAAGDDWTLRQIIIFLEIGKHGTDGVTLKDLQDLTLMTQQAVDRAKNKLMLIPTPYSPVGFGVISKRPDMHQAGHTNVFLTDAGKKLWERVNKVLKEETKA